MDVCWLGEVAYTDGLALQQDLHERRASGAVGDTLLQLTHPHVYTVGRRGSRGDVLWDDATLRERGVAVVEADRGGQVTYHGPGQLVGYPIVDIGPQGDLVRYVRDLEEVLIRALRRYGIEGSRVPGASGVWVGLSKIGAIGVKVSRGITKHGYALNVSPDLGYFRGIVPCGIVDRGVTSVAELNGDAPGVEVFAQDVASEFGGVFGCEIRAAELVR